MPDIFNPHLCGGILFGLLLEARKPRRKTRNKFDGGSDGLSAPDVYAGLIKLVTGENEHYGSSTLEKCASDYKKCVSSKGSYVPFTNTSTISSFDSAVKMEDSSLIHRMAEFTDQYLSRVQCEWLVRALIETIQSDPGIDQSKCEIKVSYSRSVTAMELKGIRNIEFYPFMVTVINFVLHYSPDAESGRATFEAWYSQSGEKAEWKFHSNIGSAFLLLNWDLNCHRK